MEFVFDIEKATAATAYLCKKTQGEGNVLKLLKMLYLADKAALVEWKRTITGDRFFSLPQGPIVSRVYDLMRGNVMGSDMKHWRSVFHPRRDNSIALIEGKEVDFDSLSTREMQALDEAYAELAHLTVGQVIDKLHQECPEWKDPNGSSTVIDPASILQRYCSSEEICETELEIRSAQGAKAAFTQR